MMEYILFCEHECYTGFVVKSEDQAAIAALPFGRTYQAIVARGFVGVFTRDTRRVVTPLGRFGREQLNEPVFAIEFGMGLPVIEEAELVDKMAEAYKTRLFRFEIRSDEVREAHREAENERIEAANACGMKMALWDKSRDLAVVVRAHTVEEAAAAFAPEYAVEPESVVLYNPRTTAVFDYSIEAKQ